jgi:NAD(P)H-dependent flavin oxidoreductase YrpB (nitropropane dioxygenase family)
MDACDFLSLEKPVLQGAMGAVARHDLVVAVSEAGGLGTLSYLPAEAFAHELAHIEESLSGKTFAANLLLPIIEKRHVEACLASSVPIVTLFYGFDQEIVDALKSAGKIVIFQIGSVEEAKRVTARGADGVIVQGYEAGGHIRGTKRLADLLPQVRDALPNKLVCSAGGIHDKASADLARSFGAHAVASGTRFLASPEAAAHSAYKQRLLEANETIATNLFGVGWRDPHRVMKNAATEKWCGPNGREPRWLFLIHAATKIASRLSGSNGADAMVARQSLNSPLYTPASLTPEMGEDRLEFVALYAGECVKHISGLQTAATSVVELS